MINFKKICRILLLAAFVCTLSGVNSHVWAAPAGAVNDENTADDITAMEEETRTVTMTEAEAAKVSNADAEKIPHGDGTVTVIYGQNKGTNTSVTTKPKKTTPSAGGNVAQTRSAVTGCSSDYGLFSGLITTGRTIFKGLRDLIYVVAGFGIIGVAVGGFFGNLNWKWLGAIVIALVVIASNGEIINMITGCENFTKSMITDTLK